MFKIVFNNVIFFSNYKSINKLDKLIVFHGLGSEARDFTFLKNFFFKKVQILIPIIPGHSNSYLLKNGDPFLDFARKIYLLFKKKKIQKYSFYVHSMGNIIGIILVRFFLKKRCNLLINNEGNLISSDAGFVSCKTISYPEREFVNEGIFKLKQKCLNSNDQSLNKWAHSVDKIKPSYFYLYCKYTVFWSKKDKLLTWINFYFKRKIYIYGEKSKNEGVLKKIFGHKKNCLSNTGHFAHFEDSKLINQFIFKELSKEG